MAPDNSPSDRPSQPADGTRILASFGAVLAGVVTIVGLSIATDIVMYLAGIYPPQGPKFLIPAAYRFGYGVLGCWLAARLAPYQAFRHALILGGLGVIVGMVGLVATRNTASPLAPSWYGMVIVLLPVPCALIGGWAYRPGPAESPSTHE